LSLTRTQTEEYFLWLCNMVSCRKHKEYMETLRQLHNIAFYSLIPNDDNRGLDGVQLRLSYEEDTGNLMPHAYYDESCSVLEMLIALADRMSFITFDPAEDSEPNRHFCFWQLIRNLNLKPLGMNNSKIIGNLLERNYTPSGDGGLFPLGSAREDQRHVEIWYQMMAYLEERMP